MEKVTFANNIPGYELGSKSAPALIVVQEWWGINEAIKETAALFAAKGYRVLIPDLYKGKLGVTAEEAHHLSDNLDFPQAVEELKAAAEYLRSSGAKKVGVIGFCMGGALSLAAAQHAAVDVAVVNYGIPPEAICQPEKIKVPVLLNFGVQDDMKGFSDPDTGRAAAKKIQGAGGHAQLEVYDEVGHAFFNVLVPDGRGAFGQLGKPLPNADVAVKAFKSSVTFLDKVLKA